MAPHPEEWQLWATKFEMALKDFKKQLADNLPKDIEGIPRLIERIKDLAASSENLQEDNNALKDQVKNLVSSINNLQEENNDLRDRVRLLEQEANQQDQLNARKSQEQQKLETNHERMKEEFYSAVSAVKTFTDVFETERKQYTAEMQELKQQSKAEVQELRKQVEALLARENVATNHAPAAVPPRASRSRANSDATTVDDSMQVDQPPNHQQPAQAPHVRIMAMQNDMTLDEYLVYGNNAIMTWERQAVMDFVNGINEFARRKVIWEKLEQVGFTWANAVPEVQRMINGGRRRSTRRQLPA